MTTKLKGGKVIASGGYGCIFNPALKCEDNNNETENKISKLMTIKHAKDEYNLIENFKELLKIIPNYQNYFLLDNFSLCKPAKLSKSDLLNYDVKCKALTKKNITSKNINKSLNEILSISMPDGGIDIEKYTKTDLTSSNILKLNNSLINLLINGIVPMNNLNIFHCDIKDSNVLVETSENMLITRIIDWGLSINHKNKNGIPRKLYRRPFQYNVPFSSVLFNKIFLNKYYEFLELNPKIDYFLIREFVTNYIFMWNDIRGPGHINAINNIIKKLSINELTEIKSKTVKEHIIEYDFTYYYIIEYLSKILEKYTHDGKLELITYFNTVFLKNIDIWGFVMIYISMFEHFYENFNELNEYQMQFINKIKYIIIHILYENPNQVIDINNLVEELTNLNDIIKKLDVNHVSKKLEYLTSLQNENGGKIKTKKQKNKNKKRKNRKTKKHKK
jgi:hypothetical protein